MLTGCREAFRRSTERNALSVHRRPHPFGSFVFISSLVKKKCLLRSAGEQNGPDNVTGYQIGPSPIPPTINSELIEPIFVEIRYAEVGGFWWGAERRDVHTWGIPPKHIIFDTLSPTTRLS